MDSERPIEKLLRAQARKRRDEARSGFEPHPATRKMLRDEAVRTLAGKRRPSSRGTPLFWPRLLWATAILAVLGVVAYMLVPVRPQSGKDVFAQNGLPEQIAPSAPEVGLAERPANPSGSPDLLDRANEKNFPKDSLGRRVEPSSVASFQPKAESVPPADSVVPSKRGDVASSLQAATADKPVSAAQSYGLEMKPSGQPVVTEAPAAAPTVASAPLFKQAPEDSKLALAPALAPAPAAEPAATRAAVAVGADMTNAVVANTSLNQEATIHQRFAQAPVTKAKAAAVDGAESPVLASFQLEQTGNQLRIVDTDGSVYSGELGLPEAERARLTENRTSAAPSVRVQSADRSFQLSGNASSSPQTFSFRVAGTNRTSNQKVVFTGSLTPVTNLSLERLNNNVGNGKADSQKSLGGQNPGPLSNSRISGSAQIGRAKTVRIEAVPAP